MKKRGSIPASFLATALLGFAATQPINAAPLNPNALRLSMINSSSLHQVGCGWRFWRCPFIPQDQRPRPYPLPPIRNW